MIKLSTMTGKLEGITALNVSSLDNSYCDAMAKVEGSVCSHCYSRRMLNTFRQNCQEAWRRNGEWLSTVWIGRDNVILKFPVVKTEFCRIHAHGEVINDIHAENLVRFIQANPTTKFGWPTKRLTIVSDALRQEGKPKNVVMIACNPALNSVIAGSDLPGDFDMSFNVVTEGGVCAVDDMDLAFINCKGKCIDCLKCYTPGVSRGVVIEKLK